MSLTGIGRILGMSRESGAQPGAGWPRGLAAPERLWRIDRGQATLSPPWRQQHEVLALFPALRAQESRLFRAPAPLRLLQLGVQVLSAPSRSPDASNPSFGTVSLAQQRELGGGPQHPLYSGPLAPN